MDSNYTLSKIVNRHNQQLPSNFNTLEPFLLSHNYDGNIYGRWTERRDINGNTIIRERRAGLNPYFHQDVDINFLEVPLKKVGGFQYPINSNRRKIITYR
jgi:hypothetical protein